ILVRCYVAHPGLHSFPTRRSSDLDAINARLTGIRDFLLLFFFIDLGAKLDFSTLGNEVGASIVLSLFVLIGNPLIVMVIMGYMRSEEHTSELQSREKLVCRLLLEK